MDNPQKFVHLWLLLSGSFEPDSMASELIHRHGGGWAMLDGGTLTATAPIKQEQALINALRDANAWNNGLT